MTPRLELLDDQLLERILDEAFRLLMEPGVRLQEPAATALLTRHGARVAPGGVRIPEVLVRRALASAPREFFLHGRGGDQLVHYGGDVVQFDPGSCGVLVLDPESLEHRASRAEDLVRLVKVTEMLSEYAAQSTAVACTEVPPEIGDLYRLFLVLWYSDKPVVTGAFSAAGTRAMLDLLAADSGDPDALAVKPRAIFDVCPSPPLRWSDFAAQSLMELAAQNVPVQIVPAPLAGATAPVTLAGAAVQHVAEGLSGLTLHQLARPGAPVVWGGAPAIFDMRTGTTPMAAVETAILAAAAAQIGRHFGLPTHAYLCGSDAKLIDAQAGMEAGIAALIGVLAGINMISGAGMLDFLNCQSAEKLVLDAEAIAAARRLARGIEPRGESLALTMFAQAGPAGEFLKLRDTRDLFRLEQRLPSSVIDRGPLRSWREQGRPDAFHRARSRVAELSASYRRPTLGSAREGALRRVVEREAGRTGLSRLPGV